ncbi:hypothetical protein [Burkholderia vietnamiensis]|uniref:hypothetical protein n=1 Tax=Burkholderia vietnamiensis TaxID=60552 RepID=UPI001CF56634|nr:hypothetical protein [Burkholderia vietnamiensis]MCA8447554.1 hypothetical protein [Burkholderia vietnamiensis]HDR8953386.1 hypothetical protein [Burkholderia vietnamiensis]HDR8989774.1 hypothetical protein [Burkholderia vietnamiensis]
MTDVEFEAMFEESLKRLDAYIATQVTDRQIFQAKGYRLHVERNKSHWKWLVDKGEKIILCNNCGSIGSTEYCEPYKTEIAKFGLCYHCNHWRREASTPDKTRLIIDGHIYGDGGNQPNATRKDWLGFGGDVWTIERDGRVWQTNNLWSGSTVPQEHRASLPDNARFVREA